MENTEVAQNCRCGFCVSLSLTHMCIHFNVLLELHSKTLKSGGEGIPTDLAPYTASGMTL